MLENNEFVLLEDNAEGESHLSHYFHGDAQHIICFDPAKVAATFAEIESWRKRGYWLVGFFAYELGYALDNSIDSSFVFSQEAPLIHFMAFEKHCMLNSSQVNDLLQTLAAKENNQAYIVNKELGIDFKSYAQHIEKIKKYIVDGYTYQVNFTSEYHFDLCGDPIVLYQKLRDEQRVRFGALLYLNNYKVLSLSPELFFSKKSDYLYAKPMKGTMPRSSCSDIDGANKNFLINDEKSRAENLMIVDLLRNDLSKIAKKASVEVSNLFEVESYKTVHQMTSTISCHLEPSMTVFDIIKNIFPCGSISGAPKHKTMQIIRELEKRQRGIYTGSIGYITPSNDMCFNVAIRTITIKNNRCALGVGGGIVYDSVAKNEFEELKLKSAFVDKINQNLKLFTLIRYKKNIGYQYLDKHLLQLQDSAAILGFNYDVEKIKNCLLAKKSALNHNYDYKIKLLLFYDGDISLQVDSLPENKQIISRLLLCKAHKVLSSNILLKHNALQCASAELYHQLLLKYQNEGYDDVVLMNEHGHITQTCLANIFIVKDNVWFTADVESGLVANVMREKVMQKMNVKIKNITEVDLLAADEVWLANSIIGLTKVKDVVCQQ